jgi:hypothetical protein
MFINKQSKEQLEYYKKMLEIIGSLSGLFSDSVEPYVQYRVAENLFCKSFNANNLSRSDCSADASKNGLGIGIKTFLEKNGATMQKVAEFNNEHRLFAPLNPKDKVLAISKFRNERIETTKRIFGLGEMIYHCISRRDGGILVYETAMDLVDVNSIKNVELKGNVIYFNDGKNDYSFNNTKTTLYKRFVTPKLILDFDVDILKTLLIP